MCHWQYTKPVVTCHCRGLIIRVPLFTSGLGGWYSYRMSKAALNMATRNLSIELGRSQPKVPNVWDVLFYINKIMV